MLVNDSKPSENESNSVSQNAYTRGKTCDFMNVFAEFTEDDGEKVDSSVPPYL